MRRGAKFPARETKIAMKNKITVDDQNWHGWVYRSNWYAQTSQTGIVKMQIWLHHCIDLIETIKKIYMERPIWTSDEL